MPKVNPAILRWARETANLTKDDAAKKLHLSSVELLAKLEADPPEKEPTRNLLVNMSKVYHRPLLTFYMSASPRKGERGEDLRTTTGTRDLSDDALLDVVLRDVRSRQNALYSALEDEESATPLSFVASIKMSDGVSKAISSIQKGLGFDLAEFRKAKNPADAFTYLRQKVEKAGIFPLLIGDLGSYHSTIDSDTFRGFALAHPVAPFIVVNDNDARSSWSFTVLHEITHIWLGHSVISGTDSDLPEERFCNDVASELLLPSKEFNPRDFGGITASKDSVDRILAFGRARNVSGSAVAYKLYTLGIIELDVWRGISRTLHHLWLEYRQKEREKHADDENGPTYFVVKKYQLGKTLIGTVSRMVESKILTTSKAAMILGMKPSIVHKLFDARDSKK